MPGLFITHSVAGRGFWPAGHLRSGPCRTSPRATRNAGRWRGAALTPGCSRTPQALQARQSKKRSGRTCVSSRCPASPNPTTTLSWLPGT